MRFWAIFFSVLDPERTMRRSEEMVELSFGHPDDVIDFELPFDARRPAEGEASLRRLLAETRSRAPEDAARSVEILTQIARAEVLQGKLKDADRSLIEAEKALPSVEGLAPRLRVLLERGRLLAAEKTPAQARERFLEVWRLALESGDVYYAIDAAHMMSQIETPKKRIEWTMRGLELAEGAQDARARSWLGVLYVRVGWHHLDLLQLAQAMTLFEKAADVFRREGALDHSILARSYAGRVLRMMHRMEEALTLQRELLAELERGGANDGVVSEEIAECLHALKRPSEAAVYFLRAYDVLSTSPSLMDQEPSRMKRLKTLGKAKDARG